jgi:hypothetical protein
LGRGRPVISWIVASHDPNVLGNNLLPSLLPDIEAHPGDELIVVEDAGSIAEAYNEGTARARNAVNCFVHHDVQVRVPTELRDLLVAACRPSVGMVGVVGSRTAVVPWWTGQRCGSVTDARLGLLDNSAGGEPAAYLDGLLLATCQPLEWESWATWHLYDHDACQQMLAAGLENWCLPSGKDLLIHNRTSPTAVERLPGWDTALAGFRAKWPAVTPTP